MQNGEITTRSQMVFGFGYFALYFALGLEIVIATPILQTLGIGAGEAGTLWAGRSLLSVLGPVVWGYYADKTQKGPRMLQVSFFGAALCHLCMWQLQGHAVGLALFFILLGFFISGSVVLVDGLLLKSLGNAHHRYGQIRLFGGLGFGLGAFWASQTELALVSEFVQSFFFASFGTYFAGTLAVFFLPAMALLPREQNILRSVARLCGSLPVLCLLIMIIAQWASHGLYTGFLAVAASKNGISLAFVGYAVVAAIVAETLCLFASARLLAVKARVMPVLFLILAVTIFRWLFSASVTEPWRFVWTQGLHGITFGLFHAWAVLQFAKIFPAQLRQTAQGWLLGAGYGLGGALGMGISGRLLENASVASAWQAMAAFAAVALVAGTLFSLLQRNTPSKEKALV